MYFSDETLAAMADKTVPCVKASLRRLARVAFAYAGVAATMILPAIALVVEVSVAKDIPEGGIAESLQTCLLFGSAVAWGSLATKARRENIGPEKAYVFVAFVSLGMFVRELDGFFDALLWHGAWAVIDGMVLAVAALALLRDWRKSLSDLADFAESHHGLMAFAAVFAAVAFSQLLGWKGVWRRVFDIEPWRAVREHVLVYDQNLERHVKNVVEEALELFSYASLFVAGVMPRILAPRRLCSDGGSGGVSGKNDGD